MLADRIKYLRVQKTLTQAELARRLSVTRSSVNAWEMGISIPSPQFIVEIARIFKVSTDYLLGVDSTATISLENLTESDVRLVHALVSHLREKNGQSGENADDYPAL